MKKALKILIIIALIVTAINYCDPGSFEKDHKVAMKIANPIQKLCKNNGMCPVDIADIQIDSEGEPSSILNVLPNSFEYRMTASKKSFVIGYKGTLDPDCGYALYGGVATEISKSMLCEMDAWVDLRKTYGILWKPLK